MSSKSLQKIKIHKSLKKEKLVELQHGFVSNLKINKNDCEYNALQDKYAYSYFLHRPVKRHLKRLAKVYFFINSAQAISLEPITTQNQKAMSSLCKMIELLNTQDFSERKLKQLINEQTSQSGKKSDLKPCAGKINNSSSKQKIKSFNLYDPYTQSLKPSSIEKIRKHKLQYLKKKKYILINKSINDVVDKSEKDVKKPTTAQIQVIPKEKNNSPIIQQKVKVQNHTKHLKLLHFINKKKSELHCTSQYKKRPNAKMQ